MSIVVSGEQRNQGEDGYTVVEQIEFEVPAVAISGSYNDLVDKPTTPEPTDIAIDDVKGLSDALAGKQAAGDYLTAESLSDYATVASVTTALASKQDTGDYATHADVAEAVSEADTQNVVKYVVKNSDGTWPERPSGNNTLVIWLGTGTDKPAGMVDNLDIRVLF